MSRFASKDEFRKTFDLLFETLSKDPVVGPKLRATRTPQRFVFTDVGLVLDVRDSDDKRAAKGHGLTWIWGGVKVTWEPAVTLELTSEVANRYFQGKENVPLALAKSRIVLTHGDVRKVLDLLPIVLPFHKKWIETLKAKGLSHLVE